MRQNTNDNFMLLWQVMIIIIMFMVYGCAEEEPSNNTTTTSPLLTDNTLPAATVVDNFELKKITIDPSALLLSGNRIFLKLNRQSGEVLFLGEIDRFRPFNLSVNLLLDEAFLNYEIFSNDTSDLVQSGVISL